ncbi:MAG TPA: hypothetical protein PKA33_07080 [Amaricoccus sp.]|uniref:hypothetical protein n=1 Tax=Amaricoccus sp. TaxID=1872485 RepID=UPI002BCCD47C|nr:hypothetical protein [Amaricoccus sp.]HMQ94649.1 hypothetical protein [Amaricoccus sp.]HMR51829.1 hypothetical protein [Amaricoccus sp.]HMR59335.1 hypothetical protein [Amaricoccus sp.]HMT99117.1 hypothetical protein [Amaricoccus sp.]
MKTIHTLSTERLTQRAPQAGDFPVSAAFFASERSIHEGGPLGRATAWKQFASAVGQWELKGYGARSIEDRTTGTYPGETGILHHGHPAPEVRQ